MSTRRRVTEFVLFGVYCQAYRRPDGKPGCVFVLRPSTRGTHAGFARAFSIFGAVLLAGEFRDATFVSVVLLLEQHHHHRLLLLLLLFQEERRQVEEADKERRAKAEKKGERSAEELAERARLLGEYGYDSDPVDEEGNPLPPEEGADGEGGSSVSFLPVGTGRG